MVIPTHLFVNAHKKRTTRSKAVVRLNSLDTKSKVLLLARASGGRRAGFLEAVGAAELLAEPLDAAGGVDELLLAGEERVAGRADVDVQFRLGAAGDERVAAGAMNVTGDVLG